MSLNTSTPDYFFPSLPPSLPQANSLLHLPRTPVSSSSVQLSTASPPFSTLSLTLPLFLPPSLPPYQTHRPAHRFSRQGHPSPPPRRGHRRRHLLLLPPRPILHRGHHPPSLPPSSPRPLPRRGHGGRFPRWDSSLWSDCCKERIEIVFVHSVSPLNPSFRPSLQPTLPPPSFHVPEQSKGQIRTSYRLTSLPLLPSFLPPSLSAGICAINVLFISTTLPESLPPALRRSDAPLQEANVWGAFRTVGKNPFIALCSMTYFLLHLALNGLQVRREGRREGW